ncbi:putative translation initiation factor SUI1 [Spironucleus salmonicida]|uniref:Translation initiation factor SUI1 n=1 Tax=Spironucleus salmonicida TaxID=348837 RepID=V6LXC3_9EUKA|nr:putative translation initiation factor SUI1 [Spironucleus salmonicida]|eukprot:EST49195.1 Putative translation initiation factor SUI1 [Spironucleus salmonicida]
MPKELRKVIIEHNKMKKGKHLTIIKNINQKYSGIKIANAMGKDLKVRAFELKEEQDDPFSICIGSIDMNEEVCGWLLSNRIVKDPAQFIFNNITMKSAKDACHF